MSRRANRSRSETGFTLLELALALGIMAVLAGAVLVPFVAQVTQRNVTSTEQILEDAKESLIGFAAATGRLPCPATATSNGQEAFQSSPAGDANNGICAVDVGFLPAVTLGFTPVDNQGFAVDAWGTTKNRIRYAVWAGSIPLPNPSTAPPSNAWPFTKRDGMRTATPGLVATADMFYVCASGSGVVAGANCGSAVTLTRNAPVVIWSSGANAATGGMNADEAQNPHSNLNSSPTGGSVDRIFVSHARTDTPEFDDVVTWIAGGMLISRMVLAGTLP
ncbi:MAG TPA: type II secretion system protein [Burkholderiales bacterium]|jgi:prepilin-type N-terminal cleavage/methylation domain-containing protein|nr:type II secretion system protein [Burkholderiales bacterium]